MRIIIAALFISISFLAGAQSNMKEKIYDQPQGNVPQAQTTRGNGNVLPSTHPSNRYRPMTDASFNEAFKRLKSTKFDKDRLTLAKYITGTNWMSAAQVLGITKLFFTDQYKLDYAKYAYAYTFDRGNYFLLLDVLTQRSNRKCLMEYVETYNKNNPVK